MSNQHLIELARKRARFLSRRTGRSEQHHLNELSRQAHRRNWAHFLQNPAEIPELEAQEQEYASSFIIEMRWEVAVGRVLKSGSASAILGAVLLLVLALIPHSDLNAVAWLVERFDTAAPVASWIADFSLFLMMVSAALPALGAVRTTWAFTHAPERLSPRHMLRLWAGTIARIVFAVAAILAFKRYANLYSGSLLGWL